MSAQRKLYRGVNGVPKDEHGGDDLSRLTALNFVDDISIQVHAAAGRCQGCKSPGELLIVMHSASIISHISIYQSAHTFSTISTDCASRSVAKELESTAEYFCAITFDSGFTFQQNLTMYGRDEGRAFANWNLISMLTKMQSFRDENLAPRFSRCLDDQVANTCVNCRTKFIVEVAYRIRSPRSTM